MGRATNDPSSSAQFRRPRQRMNGEAHPSALDGLPWLVRLMPDEENEQAYDELATQVRRASFLTVVVEQAWHLGDNGQPELSWCASSTGPNGELIATADSQEAVSEKAREYIASRGGGQLVEPTETPTRPYRSFVAGDDWRDDKPPAFTIELEASVPPRIRVELAEKTKHKTVGFFDTHDQAPLVRYLRSGKQLEIHPRLVSDRRGNVQLAFDLWAEEELD